MMDFIDVTIRDGRRRRAVRVICGIGPLHLANAVRDVLACCRGKKPAAARISTRIIAWALLAEVVHKGRDADKSIDGGPSLTEALFGTSLAIRLACSESVYGPLLAAARMAWETGDEGIVERIFAMEETVRDEMEKANL